MIYVCIRKDSKVHERLRRPRLGLDLEQGSDRPIAERVESVAIACKFNTVGKVLAVSICLLVHLHLFIWGVV